MKTAKSFMWAAWFLFYSTRLLAFNYTNQALGFSATFPDGLADLSSQTKVKSLVSLGNIDNPKAKVEMIVLQDLGKPMGREDIASASDIPQNASLEKRPWKGFDIDVFRVSEKINSVEFVTLNAQIPLKPHAIQLTVSGPASDEGKLRKDLNTIVASINGPSNWLTEEQRTESARGAENPLAMVVGLIVLIFGRIRISRHYGLKGAGARIAGFFILVIGLAQGQLVLLMMICSRAFGVKTLANVDPVVFVGSWIAFYCVLIWGFIALLIMHYGNAYAKDTDEAETQVDPLAQPPKIIKRLITNCHMCQISIPPEQQEHARTCPSCGADLARTA
jgi:uncharacterized protein with PQ loop repeat